eukprot:COSAG06_NODE_25627_length_632_cov_1.168856_1_plen_165_part_00
MNKFTYKNEHLFPQLFLCLSRACLGKFIIFLYINGAKRRVISIPMACGGAEPAGTDNNAAAKSRSRGKARGGGGEEPTSNRLFSSMNKTKAERRCGQRMAFAPLLYENAMILPRQARDKHRESTQNKDVFFLRARRELLSRMFKQADTSGDGQEKTVPFSPLLQ